MASLSLRTLSLRTLSLRIPRSKFSYLSSHLWHRAMSTSAPPRAAGRTALEVMSLSSNRAMRYVFTRTLPLRSQPEFLGESFVKCAVAEIESGTERLVEKHLSRVVDDRAAVHLHMAALAVATHMTLKVRIRDEARVMDILRGGFGAGPDAQADAKLPGHWIGKAALMFTPNRMAAVRKMTQNAESDFGAGFDIARKDDEDGEGTHAELRGSRAAGDSHRMIINRCFYADFCRAEGVPQVTRIFCALDRALFSHISPRVHGIEFKMSDSTLADGVSSPCEFGFHRRVA